MVINLAKRQHFDHEVVSDDYTVAADKEMICDTTLSLLMQFKYEDPPRVIRIVNTARLVKK